MNRHIRIQQPFDDHGGYVKREISYNPESVLWNKAGKQKRGKIHIKEVARLHDGGRKEPDEFGNVSLPDVP